MIFVEYERTIDTRVKKLIQNDRHNIPWSQLFHQ